MFFFPVGGVESQRFKSGSAFKAADKTTDPPGTRDACPTRVSDEICGAAVPVAGWVGGSSIEHPASGRWTDQSRPVGTPPEDGVAPATVLVKGGP
jgi:hypothetical protein